MKTRNWTVEEDSILKDDYNMFGPEICRAELCGIITCLCTNNSDAPEAFH